MNSVSTVCGYIDQRYIRFLALGAHHETFGMTLVHVAGRHHEMVKCVGSRSILNNHADRMPQKWGGPGASCRAPPPSYVL